MSDLDSVRDVSLEGQKLTFRPMVKGDGDAVLAFAKQLPPHDLLFLVRDITNPKVVSAWIDATEEGDISTLLAMKGDVVIGCAAVITDPLSWSQHVGEVRVLVSEDMRGIGLGRELIQEIFKIALARNLSKLMARMTTDQKGAIAIFEELGFRGEALLKDHVSDQAGVHHDLVILSCDPVRAANLFSAFSEAQS